MEKSNISIIKNLPMKQIWKENTKIIFFTSAQTNPRSLALSLDKKHGARSCNDEKDILYLGGWRSLFSRPVDSFHGTVIPGDERFPWVNKSQSRTLSTEITFHSAPPRVFPLLALFLLARFHKSISGLVSTPSLPDKDFHASIFLEDLGSIYFFFFFPPSPFFFLLFQSLVSVCHTREIGEQWNMRAIYLHNAILALDIVGINQLFFFPLSRFSFNASDWSFVEYLFISRTWFVFRNSVFLL